MKILCFEIINNRKGDFAIVNIGKRVREVWIKGGNEDCYAAYRVLTGAGIQESWKIVKKWIKVWEKKKESANA